MVKPYIVRPATLAKRWFVEQPVASSKESAEKNSSAADAVGYHFRPLLQFSLPYWEVLEIWSEAVEALVVFAVEMEEVEMAVVAAVVALVAEAELVSVVEHSALTS